MTRITAAQARALGLAARKPRITRRTAPGPYHTRCVACGATFTVRQRETEHVAPGHTRFEAVL